MKVEFKCRFCEIDDFLQYLQLLYLIDEKLKRSVLLTLEQSFQAEEFYRTWKSPSNREQRKSYVQIKRKDDSRGVERIGR